jgi:aminoglycoside phosphotransferase family enzyme
MPHEQSILLKNSHSVEDKVAFLCRPEIYPYATIVEAVETHMSWVFLTDQFVYKLKKPVHYDFLDFRTLESRYAYCKEEVKINPVLAGDTYLDVVPITVTEGKLQLAGKGEAIDWLVKMKRLPRKYMLDVALREGTLQQVRIEQAAEKLADFYLASEAVRLDPNQFRQQIIKLIEVNSEILLRKEFKLQKSLILGLTADLLHFIVKYSGVFDQRILRGRIVDGHGDLRPEHICIAPNPVIIDRVEFNRTLRILDVAEELSFLSLECEMLGSPAAGQIFFNIYQAKSKDEIDDTLVFFYKAKRAFLRAKLSISHLLEKKYQPDEQKWTNRCHDYLRVADLCCKQLSKN